jgi:hypothetical protein
MAVIDEEEKLPAIKEKLPASFFELSSASESDKM